MATYIILRVALLFFAMTGRLSPMVTIKPSRLVPLIHWYIPGKKLGKVKVTPYQFYFGIRISIQFPRLIRIFFSILSFNNFSKQRQRGKRERERVNTKIWSTQFPFKKNRVIFFFFEVENLLAISSKKNFISKIDPYVSSNNFPNLINSIRYSSSKKKYLQNRRNFLIKKYSPTSKSRLYIFSLFHLINANHRGTRKMKQHNESILL